MLSIKEPVLANPEHVAVARRRSYAIARWREQHWRSRARLDLSGAYLSGARLSGVDLSHDDLSGIDLTSSDLHHANLSGTHLPSAYLSRSNLAWANLQFANLRGVFLLRANLKGALLQNADLQDADLSYADLSLADLTGANLSGANLTHASLLQADLSRASLNRATLTGTQLDLGNLTQADLRGASLLHVSLDGTLFTSARLEMTLLGDCDMSGALDLESVQHNGPSIVGLDTLMRSGGMIPVAFLRQAGVPKAFIDVQRQLGRNPLDHCRVLLVGSIEDSAFIKRLQSDLRASGLACWHLPVDDEEALLKDESFPAAQRLTCYDQIVLVCSHHSLDSPYIWRILEQVLQPGPFGVNHNRAIVPVSLDKSLLARSDGLGEELRKRPTVELSHWQEDGSYRRGLDELVALFRTKSRPRKVEEPP